MRKSSEEIARSIRTISEYVFTFHPVALQLRPDLSPSTLYFEKDQQIIAKFDTSKCRLGSNGQTIFQALPFSHFRILTLKPTQYKWSLYKIDNQAEEFVDEAAIDLVSIWSQFNQLRSNIFSLSAELSQCKLRFIVIISEKIEEIAAVIEAQIKRVQEVVQITDSYICHSGPFEDSPVKMETSNLFSSIIIKKDLKQPKRMQKNEDLREQNPSHEEEYFSFDDFLLLREQSDIEMAVSAKQTPVRQQEPDKNGQLDPLTKTEIEIGDFIEQQSKKYEEQLNLAKNKKALFKEEQKPCDFKKKKNELELRPNVLDADAKRISITSSQLFDEKGNEIVPFYLKKHYWLALVIILVLSGWLIWMNSTVNEIGKRRRRKAARKSKGRSKKEK